MEFVFERVSNFRDYGGAKTAAGATVRRGRLFRSAHYGEASDNDVDQLRRLGVVAVIDFRGPPEKADDGHNRLPEGVLDIAIPMHDPAKGDDPRVLLYSAPPEEVARAYPPGRAFEAMVGASESFVARADRAKQYGQMLTAIIDADGAPVVINCAAGKDRTGWGAAVVLLALDVDRDQIMADYLLSNEMRRLSRSARLDELAAAGVDPSILQPFFGVDVAYMQRAFDTLDQLYGGFERYRREALGVDNAAIDRLHRALLQ